MTEAAGAFVDMGELNARAGAHIARLVGVEGAHVTSGSAGGLLLAAAACIAGSDPDRILRLPDTTGMRNEIVIQRCDRIQYDQALRMSGAVLVEVGDAGACTPEAIEAAIGPRTAALIYIVSPGLATRGVGPERMAEIAHDHGLPMIVDAASTLPPVGHITRWTETGADLVILSGGKGIRGPQNTGLLCGARRSDPRGLSQRLAELRRRTPLQGQQGGDHRPGGRHRTVPPGGSRGRVDASPGGGGPDPRGDRRNPRGARAPRGGPHDLDRADDPARDRSGVTGLTPDSVMEALRQGEPPIMVRVHRGDLLIDPHCLRGDEASVVARRLREELLRRPARP